MTNIFSRAKGLTPLFLLFTLMMPSTVSASEDPAQMLGLEEYQDTDQPARFPRPISTFAENVTVVTADEIARLNAHTLADILHTVPGVQLLQMQTPGSRSAFSISGALSVHILVLIDGVSQNLLGAEDSADLASIPAMRIERIEIIKGAASTAWGPALGGVVNVITKSADTERRAGGTLSASYGERETSDLQAEVTGTIGRFGYYLNGGKLSSLGLLPANTVDLNHTYGKFSYSLPTKGNLTMALDFREGRRDFSRTELMPGIIETDRDKSRYLTAVLNGHYPFSDRFKLDFTSSIGRRDYQQKFEVNPAPPPIPPVLFDAKNRDEFRSTDLRVTLGDNQANLVAGLEYQHDSISDSEPVFQFSFLNFRKDLDRFGTYLNGTYVTGPLTILPGLRFDSTATSLSYHLGTTLQIAEDTLLRIYAGRGHSQPMVNFDNRQQDIWTVQAGMETCALPYLWLKGTYFYSNTWHIPKSNVPADYPASPVTVTDSEQDRHGFELELQTVSMYGLYLKGGYTYADVREKASGASSDYIPIHSAKLGVHYDHRGLGLRSSLTGNYVTWPRTTGNQVTDDTFIWDLHLTKRLQPKRQNSPEAFLSIRNMFNGRQYIDDFLKNAPRWVEGGVRLRF